MSADPAPFALRIRQAAVERSLANGQGAPADLVPRAREFLAAARETQLEAHRTGVPASAVARLRSDSVDLVVESLHARAGAAAAGLSLVATGGYGRAELCPLSDVDLLVLVPAHTPETKAAVESILYPLWDLGLKLSQSVRTVQECLDHAVEDLHLRVALLEARPVCGDRAPFRRLAEGVGPLASGAAVIPFARTLVDSQRRRREKAGGSAYLQEPDLKNGVGALRDVQGCLWLARLHSGAAGPEGLRLSGLIPERDCDKFVRARDTLLRLRHELHFQSTRPTEHLSLERQDAVSQGLGYPGSLKERIGAMMRDYFDAADHVRRCVQLVESGVLGEPEPEGWGRPLEADGFRITPGGVASALHRLVFEEDPARLVRLFRLCQVHEARPDRALSVLVRERAHLLTPEVAGSESSTGALRAMLTEAGRVHGAMDALREHGLLYRLVPEFRGLHCLVQFEFYHRWTADVHTLRCLRELDLIYEGATDVDRGYREVLLGCEAPSLLYAILFLHDIGKADGIAGHAERGAPVAEAVLERLGFDAREREFAATVVRLHLTMGLYWQRHDIDDPANVDRFAALCGEEQVLRYLYVHTRCDALGTSPDLWTDFKDGQHFTLYRRAYAKLSGIPGPDVAEERARLRDETARLLGDKVGSDELEAHFSGMPDGYLLHASAEEAAHHLQMIHRLIATVFIADAEESLMPIVEWVDDVGAGQSAVTVVTWDRAGLFSRLAGAFAVAGINIVSCHAFSRADDVAIDFFRVNLPAGREGESKSAFGRALTESLLGGSDLLSQVAQAEARAFETAPRRRTRVQMESSVEVYFDAALGRTVAEVQCTDRLGLLFRLGRAIRHAGYAITFANVATEQGIALDTFYLVPQKGATDAPASADSLAEALRAIAG